MIKRYITIIFISFLFLGCAKNNESERLSNYLQGFNDQIQNYKVVCILPADGCSSCIKPTIDYSKIANGDFLLILTSYYKKSIKDIIEDNGLDSTKIKMDSKNLASIKQLVWVTAPCYYFIRNGKVIKVVDLSKVDDKFAIIKEADNFLNTE